ncbi:hypothetical protein ACHAW6_009663, partial [Cyclotella cf. meneghiniana]
MRTSDLSTYQTTVPTIPERDELQVDIDTMDNDTTTNTNKNNHHGANDVHRAVADLARAYIMEEMRDDVCESDPRNLHEQPSERTDDFIAIEVSPNQKGTGIPSPSRTDIPPLDPSALESLVSASPSPSDPSANICASTASASQFGISFPQPARSNDEILSRFESILVSTTNDTESISELGTIIEARGVISTIKTELMAWTERGCCISPSSLAGEHACVSRFAEIEEMSLEDEDDDVEDGSVVLSKEEDEDIDDEDDSSVEDVGDLVLVEDAMADMVGEEKEASRHKVDVTNDGFAVNENEIDFVQHVEAEINMELSQKAKTETKQVGEDVIETTKSSEQADTNIEPQLYVFEHEAVPSVDDNTYAPETREEEDNIDFQDAIEVECEEAQNEDDVAEFHDAIDTECNTSSMNQHALVQSHHYFLETNALAVEEEPAATANNKQNVTEKEVVKQMDENLFMESGEITATKVMTAETQENSSIESILLEDDETAPTTPDGATETDICTLVDEQVALTEPEDANSAGVCTSAEGQVIPTRPEDVTETDISTRGGSYPHQARGCHRDRHRQ